MFVLVIDTINADNIGRRSYRVIAENQFLENILI